MRQSLALLKVDLPIYFEALYSRSLCGNGTGDDAPNVSTAPYLTEVTLGASISHLHPVLVAADDHAGTLKPVVLSNEDMLDLPN